MKIETPMYSDGIKKGRQSKFGGLNHSAGAGDGELYSMKNLCSDQFPVMATRPKRRKFQTLQKGNGLFAWEKLCWVDGTNFYYDGVLKGQVEDSEKSFAAMNGYIIIAPDMAYYNVFSDEFGMMETQARPVGGLLQPVVTFQDGTIFGEAAEANTILCNTINWEDYFRVGDAISITGCTIAANNITVIIREMSGHELRFYENSFTNGTDTAGQIRFTRRVPELKYMMENENRLWGCTDTTIYASKLAEYKEITGEDYVA